MRKVFIFYFLFIPFIVFSQTLVRVQDGQNLQTVIDNAPNGATILVDGGNYGSITLNKRINLIGAGAFVPNPSIIVSISFIYGADNSSITGFRVTNSSYQNCIFIDHNVSNILINRNLCFSISTASETCTSNCGNINNLTIIHNIIDEYVTFGIQSTITNFNLKNNILRALIMSGSSMIKGNILNNNFVDISLGQLSSIGSSQVDCSYNSNSYIQFKNNIFLGPCSNCNYLCSPSSLFAVAYNTISNNLGTALDATNTIDVDINTVFMGIPTPVSNESLPYQFQLTLSSPARGVGENGTDCGIFGGSDPFPPSSSIGPQIYELSAPSSVSSGQTLNVTVKAKVSN